MNRRKDGIYGLSGKKLRHSLRSLMVSLVPAGIILPGCRDSAETRIQSRGFAGQGG
jgi:hypothetical protein